MSIPSPQLTLEEAYSQIQLYMQEEKWLEAYRGCLEILRFDPENPKILGLKKHIEKTVHDNNVRAVKADLKRLQPLWQQKLYAQYLQELKKLEPYLPDYPPLKNVIDKAQAAYQSQVTNQQSDYYHQELQRIQDLAHQHKFSEALEGAEKLRAQKFYPKEVTKLIQALHNDWIDSELAANRDLVQSEKYEDMLLFYQKLLKLDPLNQKLAKLISQAKKRYQTHQLDQQKEFIYKSLEHIRTLYQLKKYDKSMAAAAEILQLDPANKEAKTLYKQSFRKIRKLTDREVIDQMVSINKQMDQEYKTAPKGFIRF